MCSSDLELASIRAEFDAFKAEAQADQEKTLKTLADALEAVAALEAERDALQATLAEAKEFAEAQAAKQAQAALELRVSKITQAVGTARADAVLEATKDMDDEQFEAVLNVMTVAGKAEANSEMFTSVGASAEVDPATVQPAETKEMQILRARYQTK